MSATYSIYRFWKPKKKELSGIEYFSPYDSFPVKDADGEDTEEVIRLFRWNDRPVTNIRDSRFSLELTLPEKETDYDRLFMHLGFSEDSVKNHKVNMIYGSGYYYDYSDGEKRISVRCEELEKFQIIVQTHCFAVKMQELWDSCDNNCYPDHDRVQKYLPDINDLVYVPISNQLLAKAEIPFLIFEKNKGRCFIEKS